MDCYRVIVFIVFGATLVFFWKIVFFRCWVVCVGYFFKIDIWYRIFVGKFLGFNFFELMMRMEIMLVRDFDFVLNSRVFYYCSCFEIWRRALLRERRFFRYF